MSYKAMPYVVGSNPPNGMAEVPTNQPVEIEFNTDLDVSTLVSIFANEQATGNRVPIVVDYKDRIVTVKPNPAWAPNTVYRITVAGDDVLDPEDEFIGIKSALGYPMAGSFTITFRTVVHATLPAPDTGLVDPPDQSVIRGDSVTLRWPVVSGAVKYEVELSQFSSLDPYSWTGAVGDTEITPDLTLEDKTYYWRVRGIDTLGEPGEWSEILTFGVRNTPADPVVPDDNPDYTDGSELVVLPEEIATYPEEEWANVALNLRTITILLPPGVFVTDSELQNAIRITKQDAFNSMGEIAEVDTSQYSVTKEIQDDGSTLVIVTLEGVI